MKKKFMVLVFFLIIGIVTGCSKNENKSEKADISLKVVPVPNNSNSLLNMLIRK